ncbi:MAG: SDR family NAD(P)-dependent oxidoreductase [Chloroflexi bacterium]|nr:SDR family NAD(P)-dependent oxidoreductase [Chloroflexota bacterium]
MKDKVVFVTGGGSGIGRACAIALAAQGAHVAVVGRTLVKCDAVVNEIGAGALAVQADIASSADVQRAIAQTVAHFGGLDVLVNSAGISPSGRITEISEAEWDECLAIDLTSNFLTARHAIPHMMQRGGGVIINVAGTFGMRAASGKAAYSTAKAGVINLTRAIALDYARDGIRCNVVCPGFVDTPLTEGFEGPGRAEFLERYQPLRGMTQAEDIATMVAWLASDTARMITGQLFAVDAGQQAGLFFP